MYLVLGGVSGLFLLAISSRRGTHAIFLPIIDPIFPLNCFIIVINRATGFNIVQVIKVTIVMFSVTLLLRQNLLSCSFLLIYSIHCMCAILYIAPDFSVYNCLLLLVFSISNLMCPGVLPKSYFYLRIWFMCAKMLHIFYFTNYKLICYSFMLTKTY